jgi:predicted nuclease of predicted toxin-antitoxin system
MANENLARDMVAGLRAAGHDVASVRESYRGMSDEDVLRTAQSQGRIVTTHDKRFGKLAFEAGVPATCGVILLRLRTVELDAAVRRVVSALRSECTWDGHVATIEEDRVRLHRLPRRPLSSP